MTLQKDITVIVKFMLFKKKIYSKKKGGFNYTMGKIKHSKNKCMVFHTIYSIIKGTFNNTKKI